MAAIRVVIEYLRDSRRYGSALYLAQVSRYTYTYDWPDRKYHLQRAALGYETDDPPHPNLLTKLDPRELWRMRAPCPRDYIATLVSRQLVSIEDAEWLPLYLLGGKVDIEYLPNYIAEFSRLRGNMGPPIESNGKADIIKYSHIEEFGRFFVYAPITGDMSGIFKMAPFDTDDHANRVLTLWSDACSIIRNNINIMMSIVQRTI